MTSTTNVNEQTKCRWCGFIHGARCPIVKAIEFHADGVTIKRVEYVTDADAPPPPQPWPHKFATR